MKDKNAIVSAAQKFAAKGQIDRAITEWEKLLADRPDGNIQNTIGDLHLKKGAETEAKKAFSKAADMFRKDGFYPKAIAIYKKILNIDPGDADAIIALAKLSADRGLTGNAIDHYYRAAEIYHKDGATEKATQLAEKMLQLSPTDVSTRSKIAYLYFRLGLRERAAAEYCSIAQFYGESGNDDRAREYFDKSIEYDPENIDALMGLSRLLYQTGDAGKAFQVLDKARAIAPDNKDLLLHYARLAVAHDRTEDAKEALLRAGKGGSSDVPVKRILGDIYMREGDLEKAWEELQPCIEEAITEQNWTEARSMLDPFRELYPVDTGPYSLSILKGQGDSEGAHRELIGLAELHEQAGRQDDALHCYREALAVRPDDSTSVDKVRELEHALGLEPREAEAAEIHEDTAAEEQFSTAVPDHNVIHFHEAEENQFVGNDTPEEDTERITPDGLTSEEISAQKAEAEFYVQQGLDGEAVKLYEALCKACPGDEEIGSRLAELKSNRTGAEEMPPAGTSETPPQASDIDADLHALFAEFGDQGDNERSVDYEAHYLAGLEYKQQGRLDEAVKELQIAAQDPVKKLRNATMLAMCYKDQEAYPQAAAEFDKILHLMSPEDSTYLHVKYELANARMANGEKVKAHELFTEINEVEPDFKDVSRRLNSLKESASQREMRQGSKRDRVSYI